MKKILRKQYYPGIFDASGLTLDRDGIQSVNEILFEAKMVSAPFTDILVIDQGIKHDQQIVVSEEFNGLSGSNRENCDTTPNPETIKTSELTYSPKKIKDRFEDCYDNIAADTFWKKFLKPGASKPDLTGTEYEAYVLTRLKKFMADPLFYRLFFLSNTSITNGDGTNTLTAGQLKYFNSFNGYFSQLEAIAALDSDRKITITENAGATTTLQKYAAASASSQPVTAYLESVYLNAPVELQTAPDVQFLVDQATATQYKMERQKIANIDLAYQRTEKGMSMLEYQGIPIIPLPTVDAIQNKYFKAGGKVTNPHFIVMIQKSNLRAGTESSAAFAQINSDYSSFHQKWFCDYEFTLDPKIPFPKMVQFAR